jgi:osmotically-inducible protein OsmY
MTNAELEADVRAELLWDARIADPSEIAVSAEAGAVSLRGTVGSLPQRRAARRAAERVVGVVAVDDRLEVRLLRKDRREDAQIRGAALRALEWNVAVPANRVAVDVEEGRVTLSGEVDWPYQARAASDVVLSLFGVLGVTNDLQVRAPTTEITGLAGGIEQALIRNAQTDAGRIRVLVDDGAVSLSGEVSSWAERDAAVAAAYAAPGVRSVEDRLVVSI